MIEEVKQAWVEALESGEYEQGMGRLRRGDTFCCLGVLCDVVNPEAWEVCDPYRIDGPSYVWKDGMTHAFVGEFMEALELDYIVQDRLINMNDEGVPFPTIATHIKEAA